MIVVGVKISVHTTILLVVCAFAVAAPYHLSMSQNHRQINVRQASRDCVCQVDCAESTPIVQLDVLDGDGQGLVRLRQVLYVQSASDE